MIADDLSRIAMSSGLAASLSRATDHARARGHIEVSLEHILLSLCDDPDAVLVLAASNVNVAELIGEVDGQLAGIPPHPDAQHTELGVSDDLRRILEAAAAAARGGRRREINGAIVLAAIVGDGKSLAAQVLGAQGMTFEGAIRALQARVSTPPPQSASPAPDAESILASARERVQSRTVVPPVVARPVEPAAHSMPEPSPRDDVEQHGDDAFNTDDSHDGYAAEDEDEIAGYAGAAADHYADDPARDGTGAGYRDARDLQGHAPAASDFDAEPEHQDSFDHGFDEPAEHQPVAPPPAPAPRQGMQLEPSAPRGVAPPPPPDFSEFSGGPPPARREQGQEPVWASWPASEPEITPDEVNSRPPPRRPEPMDGVPPPAPRPQNRPSLPPQTTAFPGGNAPSTRGVGDHDAYADEPEHSLRHQLPSGDDYPSFDRVADRQQADRFDDFGSHSEASPEPHGADGDFADADDYDEPPMPASAPFPPAVRPPPQTHTSAHDGWAPPPAPPARAPAPPAPPPMGAAGVRPPAPRPPMPSVPSAALPVDPSAGPQAYLRRSPAPPEPEQVRPGPPPLAPWPEPEARVPAPMPPAPVPPGRGEVVPFDKRPPRGGANAGPAAGAPMARAPRAEVGQLVENIPRVMRVSIPALIEVRIARADVQRLADGLQGGGAVYQHDVTVTKAMSVRLRAPDGGFFIETASPETQWIEKSMLMSADDFASWRWHVTPRDTGRKRLQLIISARTVGADGLAAETALPDQVITVRVRTNYAQTATRWAGWGAAAIVGGLLAKFGEGVVSVIGSLIG
ncbi:Clp protease N-terminal domain-containing protein [Hyphomicrobium sp. D-2]|uniref:Clp protease N-terminal domain-containing protein n=1 Tax=Hyphomicrobium sp. D-2 TaxID=3041621 RepID=UPI0024551943|nr:Clp protease N-terminal domain-containing protein [Hyphomicrobium sp. D-2]MDH4983309.1 Clp protease N-terminal domain-containing protein [Hyphomicrobium sp. D-2]